MQLKNSLGSIASISYGALSLVGGVIGYVQAKSKVSLILGIIFGVLLIVAGLWQLQNRTWGLLLGIFLSADLVAVFAVRLWKTQKFMPAGLMLVAGIAASGAMLYALLAQKA